MRPAEAPSQPFSTCKVKSVHAGPVVENFDIEVEDVHEFYAAGLCVKNCTGNYHPHGDGSVGGSIANMTQFSQRHPLVVGIGNFGWHDAPPSAMRYTSAYLSEYALSMLDASELTQVPMDASYDGKNQEPRYLPARLPHLLVGGCRSLASGYRGYIPPCDADWVMHALRATVEHARVRLPRSAFAYRWGGTPVGITGDWLKTGEAAVRFRPSVVAEGRRVLITSLAPGLPVRTMCAHMERCPALASVSEETPERGELVRIVCIAKRGGDPGVLMAHAARLVGKPQSYSFLSIRQFHDERIGVDYEPVVEGPLAFLRAWVRWRLTVVSGAARFRADEHDRAAARLALMVRAIHARKQLLAILEQSRDKPDLVARIGKLLAVDRDRATAVADLPFHRLARMNVPELKARIAEHERRRSVELGITRKPDARMMLDAEHAHAAALRVREIAAVKPKRRSR